MRKHSAMLYTPLLPEVAAGAMEPRHLAIPLWMVCPSAVAAPSLDEGARRVTVVTDLGSVARLNPGGNRRVELEYERLVIALGASRGSGEPNAASSAPGRRSDGEVHASAARFRPARRGLDHEHVGPAHEDLAVSPGVMCTRSRAQADPRCVAHAPATGTGSAT